MKAENYINKSLWDEAKWRKTAFLVTEDLDQQPGIALCFENLSAGKKIFQEWRETFGGVPDRKERLRIAIIRGRHPDGRNGFTLAITTDTAPPPGQPLPTSPSYVMAEARWRFQGADEPQQSLDWFQASFQRHRMFFVVPISLADFNSGSLIPDLSNNIGKTRVYIRTVEDVTSSGVDDPDSMFIGR